MSNGTTMIFKGDIKLVLKIYKDQKGYGYCHGYGNYGFGYNTLIHGYLVYYEKKDINESVFATAGATLLDKKEQN